MLSHGKLDLSYFFGGAENCVDLQASWTVALTSLSHRVSYITFLIFGMAYPMSTQIKGNKDISRVCFKQICSMKGYCMIADLEHRKDGGGHEEYKPKMVLGDLREKSFEVT